MTDIAVKPQTPRFELLGNPRFMLLWAAYGISAIGDHISELAVLKTQNAVNPAVDVTPLDARMTFLFFVPFFILGPLAGCLADRLPRRGLMITADLARFAVLLSFGVLMGLTREWTAWGPFLPLVLVGTFAALFSPARAALLPTLIRRDQFVRANSLISGLGIIAAMVALLVGGYLAEHYDPQIAFRVDAATFLASATLLCMLRAPRQRAASNDRYGVAEIVRQVKEGFRYTACHRRVIELLAVAAVVWFSGALIKCVIPAIVRDTYGGTYQDIGGFRIYLGIGFIVGSVAVSILGDALRGEIAITWGLFGVSAAVIVFASSVFLPLSPTALYWVGATGLIGIGVFGVTVMIGLNTLLQRIVPDRFRGRVFGVKDFFCTGALLAATAGLALPQETRVDQWVGFILGGVAVLAFVAGLTTIVTRIRRSDLPAMTVLCEHLNEFLCKAVWGYTAVDRWRVPRGRPVILTANHTCPADPLFLAAAMPHRVISFMVAVEYTKWPIFSYVMRCAHCISVRRGEHDIGATKQAIRHIRDGKIMGIFIEGRIVHEGETAEPLDGVAMIAMRTGAQVVPAHISGVLRRRGIFRGLFARHRARVRYGAPVDLSEFMQHKPDRAAIRAATMKIHAAILALAPVSRPTCERASPTGTGAKP
ncbi:MAG: MFS transporter [Planctomycetes bacterium]|nr:MFS transporter [Planctomycetota bacterium]